MLVKNIDVTVGLVNGARGVITKFVENPMNWDDDNNNTNEILPEVEFSVVIRSRTSTVTRIIGREKWFMTNGYNRLVAIMNSCLHDLLFSLFDDHLFRYHSSRTQNQLPNLSFIYSLALVCWRAECRFH
jgi:hypothetical protein